MIAVRSTKAAQNSVRAWSFNDSVLESYRYGPGRAGAVASHAHPDYQLCISVDTAGEYWYRGARHRVPARSISLLHPDEPHAARDPEDRDRSSEYWVLYFASSVVSEVAETTRAPFVVNAVQTDSDLFTRFTALPRNMIEASSQLARESALRCALHALLAKADAVRAPEKHRRLPTRRLERVRELLEDDPSSNPSLATLAKIAGLSPWRFCREFTARFGQPPHAYLLHARIRRAKALLLNEVAIGEVALRCGFTDQSHFTHCFRRYVDVTPGRYRCGKNVQYTSGTM